MPVSVCVWTDLQQLHCRWHSWFHDWVFVCQTVPRSIAAVHVHSHPTRNAGQRNKSTSMACRIILRIACGRSCVCEEGSLCMRRLGEKLTQVLAGIRRICYGLICCFRLNTSSARANVLWLLVIGIENSLNKSNETLRKRIHIWQKYVYEQFFGGFQFEKIGLTYFVVALPSTEWNLY